MYFFKPKFMATCYYIIEVNERFGTKFIPV